MNANQIINMVVRIVVQKLVRSGVNAGVNAASRRMGKGNEETVSAPGSVETQKRAKQTMRLMRRLR